MCGNVVVGNKIVLLLLLVGRYKVLGDDTFLFYLQESREDYQELKVELEAIKLESQHFKKKGNSLFGEVSLSWFGKLWLYMLTIGHYQAIQLKLIRKTLVEHVNNRLLSNYPTIMRKIVTEHSSNVFAVIVIVVLWCDSFVGHSTARWQCAHTQLIPVLSLI